MEENERLKILLKSREADIKKKEEQIIESEYNIELYGKLCSLGEEELSIKRELFKNQIENFKFSENHKPTEEYLMTEDYESKAKELQRIFSERQLLDIESSIRVNKRHAKKTLEDLETIKAQLVFDKEKYNEELAKIKGD